MLKILKTFRNNWKKTVFSLSMLYYGYNFADVEYSKNLLIRKYCKEAVKFGDVPLDVYHSPRHIVVILNPAANKRKAKKEYEKYCAPLLHLSGACVSVLNTNEETDAIILTSQIPDTADALIIAGGDGTVSEIVTGLLRRKNDGTLREIFPIGILPLGKTNSLANELYANGEPINKLHRYYIMMEATFSIIKEVTSNVNAMEINNIDDKNSSGDVTLKPVYAVDRLHIGAFRNANIKEDKYWYFGKLRSYASYLFGSYNRYSPIRAELKYTPPCTGCSKCYQNRIDSLKRPRDVDNQRWWHAFIPRFRQGLNKQITFKDYEKIENPLCDKLDEILLNSTELSISPQIINNIPSLRVDIGPESISYIDFVKEGWRRIRGQSCIKDLSIRRIDAQNLFLTPRDEIVENEPSLSIDGEEYELKKIRVKLLHNILPIFVSSSLFKS